jgi:8-oxo-dGTP pyrophosphatase MutT (NUDIX family)
MTHLRYDELPRGVGETAAVEARLAASVIVVRPGRVDEGGRRPDEGVSQARFEVLMIRRHERASFAPNAWVFPGGAVDDLDHEIAREHGSDTLLGARRVAAVRELFEEAGLWLGAPLHHAEQKRRRLLAGEMSFRDLLAAAPVDFYQLVWTSHWITPVGMPKRYDTYFFLARASEDAVATPENSEAVEVAWISPADALARHAAWEFEIVFPTFKNLEALGGFDSIAGLLASREGARIPAMQPVIVVEGGQKKIVLP